MHWEYSELAGPHKAESVKHTENDLRKGEPDLTSSLFSLGAGGRGEQVSMNDPKK